MSMTSAEMVKEIVDRIDDYLHDPEPVYDELIESLSPPLRQQLWFACKSAHEYLKAQNNE